MPLKQQIIRAKEDLLDNEDRADIIDCCIWIMKLIVRAGLALVIEKEHRYTRDLYPAYQIFAKHYHEKGAEMKQALQYAIAPVDNPKEISRFLEHFGSWMIEESEKWLEVHNPTRLKH
ncbi:hypothetical protein [Halalkalibacterium halodurans]|uniref:hypothetical protein n=1 Tax=Halalkalibacterium halodurans TaxID=86665 RepID=UPI001FBBC138|nr:hypothetical protein [Halalkalibacterium halodurans]